MVVDGWRSLMRQPPIRYSGDKGSERGAKTWDDEWKERGGGDGALPKKKRVETIRGGRAEESRREVRRRARTGMSLASADR